MTDAFTTPEIHDWQHARRAAFVHDVLAAFTHRPIDLLPFEEVRQKLRLGNIQYLGVQAVSLDQIVGSVGRYQDFTRAFFPRQDHLKERWRRVDQLLISSGSLPPIELFQVGQAYFVRDGNHRVSVARQHKMFSIDAYVWECTTRLPLEPDSDIDELLCETAHEAFVERTNIDYLCPDLRIKLTQPDGYEELLCEIEAYQGILSQIDEREMPFDEAVTLWGEMRYSPIVEIIRQRDVLHEFPGRTQTDLYLWLLRNQEELQSSYELGLSMEEAADVLGKGSSKRHLPAYYSRRAARRLAYAIASRADRWWRASRQALRRKSITQWPPEGE